ncbi:hypothetical protein DEO72_LG8g1849 [Vigna unguiculata]|uniref:Uncharacterized protein n=1 Tax=Vigna unguiculata TaxID=3917 RepID=A0A4D6MT66_VIGUN|nr:hypothetical protein DEO72_LG8g1849 [Vigna unguiculata]
MLLPGFGEQVSGRLLSGFDEQARVVVVSLRKSNVLTEFWQELLLMGFGEQVRVVLLLGFGEQVRVVRLPGFGEQVKGGLLLGFGEQARVVICESQGRQRSYRVLVLVEVRLLPGFGFRVYDVHTNMPACGPTSTNLPARSPTLRTSPLVVLLYGPTHP